MGYLEDIKSKLQNCSEKESVAVVFVSVWLSFMVLTSISQTISSVGSQFIKDSIVVSVAMTSLYIAARKLLVSRKHSVQTISYIKTSPFHNGDFENPANGVEFSIVNLGDKPITVMAIPIFWVEYTEEGFTMNYDQFKLNDPIDSGSVSEYGKDFNARMVFIKDCRYLDSLGDSHIEEFKEGSKSQWSYSDRDRDKKIRDAAESAFNEIFSKGKLPTIGRSKFLSWEDIEGKTSDEVAELFFEGVHDSI